MIKAQIIETYPFRFGLHVLPVDPLSRLLLPRHPLPRLPPPPSSPPQQPVISIISSATTTTSPTTAAASPPRHQQHHHPPGFMPPHPSPRAFSSDQVLSKIPATSSYPLLPVLLPRPLFTTPVLILPRPVERVPHGSGVGRRHGKWLHPT